MHLGIIGGAGTGKTKIINVLHPLFERELPRFGDKDTEKVTEKISFTGMAAANIDGRTWHSFLGVGHGKIESLKDISGASKAESRSKLSPIEVIIEDEISLESSNMDTYMNYYLNHVLEKNQEQPYGGKSIIKVGDFMQLKPYGGSPIYPKLSHNETDGNNSKNNTTNRAEPNNPYVQFNINRWAKNFKCFELTQCMRQQGDDQFARLLRIARYITITKETDLNTLPAEQKEVISFLRSRVIQANHPNYPHTALHIYPTNKDADAYNSKMIATVPDAKELPCYDSKMDHTGTFNLSEAKNAREDFGLPKILTIGISARVMVTKNHNVDDKIVNGTIGTVVALSKENGVDTIWVKPDDETVGILKQKELSQKQRKKYPGVIPIVRIESNISVANDNSTYKRRQFPLKLCYAATIHKYQGRSLDQIVIGGFNSRWMQGMLYTALTRCRTAKGLFLDGFKPDALRANIDGAREIERIRKHSLINQNHERLDFFKNYPPENWNFICLQNVRSLNIHKDDVLEDPIIQAAAMVCLTETSLTDTDWGGWKEFEKFSYYHKRRQDTQFDGEKDTRKSGGVALMINRKYNSNRDENREDKNLEMVSAVADAWGNQIVTSGIYKDHRMPRKTFLSKMKNVFENHKSSLSIILGDFNLHDENGKDMEQLNSLARNNGFIPVVREGTTINGHLLDQVFITDTSTQCLQTVVLPSYFSDHNLVVVCMKKHDLSSET